MHSNHFEIKELLVFGFLNHNSHKLWNTISQFSKIAKLWWSQFKGSSDPSHFIFEINIGFALSDIDFKNKMAWIWITLNNFEIGAKMLFWYQEFANFWKILEN